MTREKIIKDLTLLLLWLTAWEEKVIDDIKVHRSWKGYDFGVLSELMKEELISGSYKAKSAIITDKGIEEAKKINENIYEYTIN